MRVYKHKQKASDGKIYVIFQSEIHLGFAPDFHGWKKFRFVKHGIRNPAYSFLSSDVKYALQELKDMDKDHKWCIRLPFPMMNDYTKFIGFHKKI